MQCTYKCFVESFYHKMNCLNGHFLWVYRNAHPFSFKLTHLIKTPVNEENNETISYKVNLIYVDVSANGVCHCFTEEFPGTKGYHII